ncbi:3-deoxy-D-manno-octulosonic acid kinase [Kineobactrum salinum]|uniref:3-deoxy-D-manno-octulosonic acid kinase n=1 Tax=Kineobactrum salinum TaxID=2708301 RepID=A0A6C0U070_9GAMM|nr:3-deoxy-D-manno-octulosonic acid kinase [Kineobactrum salinum]QIB65406.1 3-deoxy-D-manno-octulosonic acid kinase [Kineobactrum salinum]
MTTNTQLLRSPGRQLLVDTSFAGVTESWLTPGFWGERARPVATGGRGGAWFLETDRGEMVLRHYLRGGMAARLSRCSYLFTGFRRSRSLAEFNLLQSLAAHGLPVPVPVAALAVRNGLITYRAAILLLRIPGACPLPAVAELEDGQLWRDVGQLLRRFHDCGLDHVDLNCDNILLAEGQLWLIDFDRCRLHTRHGVNARWKRRNMLRLQRSVEKRCQHIPPARREQLWQLLCNGYRGDELSSAAPVGD